LNGCASLPRASASQVAQAACWKPRGRSTGSTLAELVFAPPANHQPGFKMRAQCCVIIGEEAVIVAVVGQIGLRPDGGCHGRDRIRVLVAQDVLKGLQLVDAVKFQRCTGEGAPRPVSASDKV